MKLTLLLSAACLLLGAPLHAGLIDKHFEGKTDTEVAAEFEATLGTFLQARLQDPMKPRMWHTIGKDPVWLELIEVKGDSGTWQTLVQHGWYKDLNRYAFEPFGKTYTFKHAEVPAADVLSWFSAKYRLPQEMVGLACWFAGRGALTEANHALSDLATVKTDQRADVEAWLCAKYGWSAPKDGLTEVPTYDLMRYREGMLLLNKEAAAEHYSTLDKEAKKVFKDLEKLQGGDVKSKPGLRRGQPTMRLATLREYVDLWATRYAGTDFIDKKGTQRDLDALRAAIDADLEWIKTESYRAERLGIENDWAGAAAAYDQMLRADPLNIALVEVTAQAYYKKAVVTDGARQAEDKDAAKRAAQLYERAIEIYPKSLAFRNHAGVNWLASGDAKKAKAHHQEVMRRTEGRDDLNENEQGHRSFAKGQLDLIG
jgi:tetratricopeptide (TPR) repeat protein